MNKFIEYCIEHKITCGFEHKIPDEIFPYYLAAVDNKLVKIGFSPYGETYEIIMEKILIGFWKPRETYGFLSQWYKSNFIDDDGTTYNCAEQYMMAQKALLFGDNEIFCKIMNETNPYNIKNLGKLVRNFNDETWNKNKFDIVYNGNLLKFSQNEELKQKLLDTENKILVEASPYDKIWGIGLSVSDKDFYNPILWKGENLLGKILMKVRNR